MSKASGRRRGVVLKSGMQNQEGGKKNLPKKR